MERELSQWYSPSLNKEMPIVCYGHYGFSLLLVPTAAADYLEYERFQLIDCLAPLIDQGKMKVYSVNSINNESWLNKQMEGSHKAIRHNQFNNYIFNEIIPHIKRTSSNETPLYIAGASFGALHSMNLFLKRPDLLDGVIAMSGVYDLHEYTDGYSDDQTYMNSPMSYLPNLSDDWYLSNVRKSHHLHIFTGSGAYEDPNASRRFKGTLEQKGIYNADVQIWDEDWTHDWPTWRKYLPELLSDKF